MRLIDADAIDIKDTIGGNNEFADCIRDSVMAVLDNAPTIDAIPRERIEAMKAEILNKNDMDYFENSNVWQIWFIKLIAKYCGDKTNE